MYVMKKGSALSLIITLVVLFALAYAAYYFYKNYSQTPNKTTKDTANAMFRYPDAKKWEQTEAKNICLFKGGDCAQPITITFESVASWSEVYGYYTKYMPTRGWVTNSSVVTSIPTNVVFNKAQGNCKAALEPKSESGGIYTFTIACAN